MGLDLKTVLDKSDTVKTKKVKPTKRQLDFLRAIAGGCPITYESLPGASGVGYYAKEEVGSATGHHLNTTVFNTAVERGWVRLVSSAPCPWVLEVWQVTDLGRAALQ